MFLLKLKSRARKRTAPLEIITEAKPVYSSLNNLAAFKLNSKLGHANGAHGEQRILKLLELESGTPSLSSAVNKQNGNKSDPDMLN